MVKDKKILGIIPARGGSKSIPRKNIKNLCGKPLIAWTIEAVLESGVLDRVIVSTDDDEIAEVAKKYGAEVPFMRPPELALDTTPTEPVLCHIVGLLEQNENYKPDAVFLLEPTAPGRRPFHIVEAVRVLQNEGADSVVGVVEVSAQYNPHWALTVADDGFGRVFTGIKFQEMAPRRQYLPKVYAKNGAVYLFLTECLFKNPPSRFGDRVKLYVMDPLYNIDIDEPEDWIKAERHFEEILMKHGKKSEGSFLVSEV